MQKARQYNHEWEGSNHVEERSSEEKEKDRDFLKYAPREISYLW